MSNKISLDTKIGVLSDRIYQSYMNHINGCDIYTQRDCPERFFDNYQNVNKKVVQLTDKNWNKVWRTFLFLLQERLRVKKNKVQ